MNQPKTKPMAAAAAVAPTRKPPYTAARHGKDGAVTGAGAEGFGGALDRRVTEGFNLVHGRLDVIQEDVRENRRDIKEFRRELSAGLKDATAERARLAEKTYLDRLRAEMNERFVAAEESQRQFRAEMNERFAAAEESQRQFRAEWNDRFAAAEESQRQFRAEWNDRFAASEESQRHFRAEWNERFAASEESQRQLIGMVSKALAASEAASWTRRKITVGIWVAVGAGTSLLVIGAVMRPVLERVVQALLGG